MSHTTELIAPEDPGRIVPHEEGCARLAQLREWTEREFGETPDRATRDKLNALWRARNARMWQLEDATPLA